MERGMLDFSVKEIKCIPGGYKEACVFAREYLQNVKISQLGINAPNSAVTPEEFINAIETLMAYAWANRDKDCVPERWYCDNDCSNIDKMIFCPGEYQIASKDEQGQKLELCPYYRDSYNI